MDMLTGFSKYIDKCNKMHKFKMLRRSCRGIFVDVVASAVAPQDDMNMDSAEEYFVEEIQNIFGS